MRLSERSCFVLTEKGALDARHVCPGKAPERTKLPGNPDGNRPDADGKTVPRWDGRCRELRVQDRVVKQFNVPARNQELILAAFEELGWPPHVDDPLPPLPGVDSKQRLHDTINRLNRNQKHRLLHFRGDGWGQGIRWHLLF